MASSIHVVGMNISALLVAIAACRQSKISNPIGLEIFSNPIGLEILLCMHASVHVHGGVVTVISTIWQQHEYYVHVPFGTDQSAPLIILCYMHIMNVTVMQTMVIKQVQWIILLHFPTRWLCSNHKFDFL